MIGGGLELALPMGDFGDAANMGFGFTLAGQYGFRPNIDFMAQLGYIMWSGKDAFEDYDWSAIPIQFGAKYFFAPSGNRFYVGGLAGFHMFKVKADYNHPVFGHVEVSDSEAEFGLAPMGGYEMAVGQNMVLDLSARYQFVSDDLSYFGARVGLLYKLK
jgi:outer membrane protein W